MSENLSRIALGILVAPLLFVVVWSYPMLKHQAFTSWVIINSVLAYLCFVFLGLLCHVILKYGKLKKVWHYMLVMFGVAFLASFLFGIYGANDYNSLYYAQTQVVENSQITPAGYLLKSKEAFIHGIVSSIAMSIFWFIAVFKGKNA